MLHFYWTSKRTVVSKVVIFSSVWVVAGCGLSHSGPAVTVKRRDGPCLWTETREEDVQLWGPMCPVVTHSQPPPELPTAMTKIPDPVMQTLWSHFLTCIDVFILPPSTQTRLQHLQLCRWKFTTRETHIDVTEKELLLDSEETKIKPASAFN